MELELKYNQAENCLNLVPVEYPSVEQQEPLKKIHLKNGALCVGGAPLAYLDVVQINHRTYGTNRIDTSLWGVVVDDITDEITAVPISVLLSLAVEVFAVVYSTGNVH